MALVAPDLRPPLQVGAVLIIDVAGHGAAGDARSADLWTDEIGRRLSTIPRLRQRLVPAGFGGGRPVWVDDPDFVITDHLTSTESPHDVASVVDVAADLLTAPLPRDRPLWTARWLPCVGGDRAALIVVFHHVLADGIGGLALLTDLVDGGPDQLGMSRARMLPSHPQLVAEAARERWRTVRRIPQLVRRAATGLTQLGPTLSTRAVRSSLNRPTGPDRRILVVRTGLRPVIELAHRYESGVNDVLLAVITGGLHDLLRHRGEQVEAFVVSVPFSSRPAGGAPGLGNRSGVVPMLLPATGTLADRVTSTAQITARAKRSQRGAATAVLGPAFRALATLGLYCRFLNRQQRIHTVVSNVRGPEPPLSLRGCPIVEVIPLSAAPGNLTVVFEALSYSGQLTLTISADPRTCPDAVDLRRILQHTFDEITTSNSLGSGDDRERAPGVGQH